MSTTTATAVEPIIEARKLEKFYPQPDGARIQVIAPTDIAIYPGQIIALLGPSGCGKSTMLRMLTGLSPTSGGAVYWHGQPVQGETPNVAIVFQSFALFPWLTVIENVEAPLEARELRREMSWGDGYHGNAVGMSLIFTDALARPHWACYAPPPSAVGPTFARGAASTFSASSTASEPAV